jgi:predicted secreted hydrolase
MQPLFAPPSPFAPSPSKRRLLQAGSLALLGSASYPGHALPERVLSFPRDHGAHPDLSTEWWYITGYATSAGGRAWGFQVTFFRSRVPGTQAMRSAFAAKQLLFAHCAITDVRDKKLLHDQRIARQGFGIAQASEQDTDVKLRNWTLQRSTTAQYQARIQASDFAMALDFTPTQPLLLQGNQGLSRKGPKAEQASYYYSQPQLAAQGRISLQGASFEVQGTAWLDHEWSQALLHPEAVGWDWIGINLLDGSALTAFQLRRKDGSSLWTGGSFRATSSSGLRTFIAKPGEVQFQAIKGWTSPLTGAKYPVQWLVRTAADYYTVKAVVDNQELDSRQTTGAVYWEGLSDVFDSNEKLVGRGYLEMTGYAAALRV